MISERCCTSGIKGVSKMSVAIIWYLIQCLWLYCWLVDTGCILAVQADANYHSNWMQGESIAMRAF
jgi:hypothetical protein